MNNSHKKKVFISGNFNILHPGHLRLFKFARELGDELIVGVISDRIAGKNAYINESLRLDGLLNQVLVTDAFIVNEPIQDLLLKIKPDIVLKGKEFELIYNPEAEVMNVLGGKLIFSSGETSFSSIDLLSRDLSSVSKNLFRLPGEYLASHIFDRARLLDIVEGFQNIEVCVIGDLIIDEYITCEPVGMSQEDPTIVVTPYLTEKFLGGAGIVAAHAAGLGATAHYLGVAGEDLMRDYAHSKFEEFAVKKNIFVDDSRPTTLKTRYRANGKTLLRVNCLHKSYINHALQEKILISFKEIAKKIKLVIFSDFNHGCLPLNLIEDLVAVSEDYGLIMAADSQSSSQIGDVLRYKNMDLLTPTEREARLAMHDQDSGLVVLAEKLKNAANAKNVLLKLGSEGAILVSALTELAGKTDRLPALNPVAVDSSGAGDSMLIATALSLAAGAKPNEAALIGSVVAAIQVSRMGNIPVTRSDVKEAIEKI